MKCCTHLLGCWFMAQQLKKADMILCLHLVQSNTSLCCFYWCISFLLPHTDSFKVTVRLLPNNQYTLEPEDDGDGKWCLHTHQKTVIPTRKFIKPSRIKVLQYCLKLQNKDDKIYMFFWYFIYSILWFSILIYRSY